MPLRNKSMTLMRFCGFSHHGYRFFAVALNDALPSSSLQQQILHIRFGWRLTFPLLWRLTLPSLWRLFSNCHSERSQESLEGKTGNGMVKRSKGSMTLMTYYRFPHHGNRFFAVAQNDALPWVLLYQQAWKWLESQLCRLFNVILNGGKMPCEKDGKQQCDKKRRIYSSDDSHRILLSLPR